MNYFFPLWGDEPDYWQYRPSQWHRKDKENIFIDETAYQISSFLEKEESLELVLIEYNPQLRYFLNEQQILEANYWSVFDEMQGVESKTGIPLSYQDIEWPEGGEVVYTPFSILFLKEEEIIGQIELGNAGQMIWIDYYEDNDQSRRVFLDDRGFQSSVLYKEGDLPLLLEYLDISGEWVIREYYQIDSQQIEINPKFQHRFNSKHYESMDLLIEEKVKDYIDREINENDLVIITAHETFFKWVQEKVIQMNYVISINNNFVKTSVMSERNMTKVIEDAKWLWFNYQNEVEKLDGMIPEGLSNSLKYIVTPPIDKALTHGKSNQIKEIIITVVINAEYTQTLVTLFDQLTNLMNKNNLIKVNVHFFGGFNIDLEEKLAKFVEANQVLSPVSDFSIQGLDLENTVIENKVTYLPINKKTDLLEGLSYSRILIDWQSGFQNQLSLLAMKIGVPIVVDESSNYIEHKVNGWVLEEQDDLKAALYYYLNERNHWNAALAYDTQSVDDLLNFNYPS